MRIASRRLVVALNCGVQVPLKSLSWTCSRFSAPRRAGTVARRGGCECPCRTRTRAREPHVYGRSCHMGKRRALARRLRGRQPSDPLPVRHAWEVGAVSATLAEAGGSPCAALAGMITGAAGRPFIRGTERSSCSGVTEQLRRVCRPDRREGYRMWLLPVRRSSEGNALK